MEKKSAEQEGFRGVSLGSLDITAFIGKPIFGLEPKTC
jgi:hypothetical protein